MRLTETDVAGLSLEQLRALVAKQETGVAPVNTPVVCQCRFCTERMKLNRVAAQETARQREEDRKTSARKALVAGETRSADNCWLPKTAEGMLALIDRFLAVQKGSGEGGKLFAVLAALRGPDCAEENHLKDSTTAPIRRTALPRFAGSGYGYAVNGLHVRPLLGTHFQNHVREAADVLGLK